MRGILPNQTVTVDPLSSQSSNNQGMSTQSPHADTLQIINSISIISNFFLLKMLGTDYFTNAPHFYQINPNPFLNPTRMLDF